MSKKKAGSSFVEFTLEEAKEEMRDFIETNRKNAARGIKKKVVLCLEGHPGLGKTSMPRQLTEEMGIAFSQLNLSQIDEMADLVGYPIIRHSVKRVLDDGTVQREYVSERNIDMYLSRGWVLEDAKPMMGYAPPEWITNKGDSGILLIDDFTRAQNRFMQSVMELINHGHYISWQLPQDWHIMLTSNPDDGTYHVESLDDAQQTRFFTCRVKYDRYVWAKYAEGLGIDGRCINFLLLYPEAVIDPNTGKMGANPRQWTDFFLSIGNSKDFSADLAKVSRRGEMSVGAERCALFIQYINNKLDKLISPEEIFSLKEDVVLYQIKDCVGTGKSYRADIASTLATRLINYCLNYASNNPVDDKMIDRVEQVILSQYFASDINFQIAKKLQSSPKFRKLISRNSMFKYLAHES